MRLAFLTLLAALLAASFEPTASQCHSYLDDYNWYTVSSCPLTSTTRVPITFTNATLNAIPTSDDMGPGDYDNGYIAAQLPFPVLIYGTQYHSVFISVNGGLFFGHSATSDRNDAFPMYNFESSPTYTILPVIAALWSDHYWDNTIGSISYSTEGMTGSRLFIVRYDHLLYADTRLSSNASVSFDVLFDESNPGSIEIRYFQYDNLPSAGVNSNIPTTVGLMSNAKPFIAILNSENDWTTIEDTLVNRSIIYTTTGTGQTYDCGSLGYNLTSLMGTDLTYDDSDGNTVVYRPCGTVVNPSCINAQGGVSTDMICFIPSNTSVPVSNVANFWNIEPIYQFFLDGRTGVQAIYIDQEPCDDNFTPRTTVIDFICQLVHTPLGPKAHVTGFERPTSCITTLEVQTTLACGPGARNNDTQNPNPASTLAACVVIQGVLYNAHLCPRDSSSAGYLPVDLTAPLTLPTHPYYASDLIPIGFPFYFYGQEWDALYVTMNGGIFFNAQVATPLLDGPRMAGIDNEEVDFYPLIAPFSMPLSTLNLVGQTGSVSYSYEGNAPNRQFIVRFSDVQYFGWDAVLFMGASFDVVLSESPSDSASGIEVRYYSISSNPNFAVQIGVHGDESLNSYTSFNNYLPLSPALAGRLQGATLSFAYTGVRPADGCTAFGADFSSVNVSYSDTGATYFINMCGSLTYPSLCTSSFPKSSICQVTSDQSSAYNLAIYNPSAIKWSVSPSPLVGVRALLADGEFCGDAQRIVVIDYLCNLMVHNTSRGDYVASFIESPTCTYNFQIYTERACQAEPTGCTLASGPLYNMRLCPVDSVHSTPTTLTHPTLILQDAYYGSQQIPIGFPMSVYGLNWTHVWVHVDGQLAFGAQAPYTYYTGDQFPLLVNFQDSQPIVGVFMAQLRSATQPGNISYSVEGSAPSRRLVIRWAGVPLSNDSSANSFDVILYEGITGLIEVVYFTIDSATLQNQPILGIQSDDGTSYTALNLAQSNYLQGQYLSFFYTGIDYSTNKTCGGLGYNFLSIANTDLTYAIPGANTTIYYNLCGVVQNSACSMFAVTENSMACAVQTTDSGTIRTEIAVWNPASVKYNYLYNGVQQVVATGPWCVLHSRPSTLFTDFICDTAATTPFIIHSSLAEVTNGDDCVVIVQIATNLACGGGNLGYKPVNVSAPPPLSSNSNCYSLTGNYYSPMVCPRQTTDTYYWPQAMTNPITILSGSDNDLATVPIGFPFAFYGIPDFVKLNVSTNGNLQFGDGADPFPYAIPLNNYDGNQGQFSINSLPVIAPFWTDLVNGSPDPNALYNGSISYSHEGTAPNRQLIVRFNMVDYINFQYYPGVTGVSFDVVLSEPNGIEFRYYLVNPNPTQAATIGLRGDDAAFRPTTTYVPVWQAQSLIPSQTNLLQGSTVAFTWSGLSGSSICGNKNFSLIDISNQDMMWTDPSTGHVFYHRACGIVSASACVNSNPTAHSSFCETNNGVGISSLGLFYPPGATWIRLSNGLQLQQADGSLCGQYSDELSPRSLTISYICSATATTPQLTSVVNTVCASTATVMTAAVCQYYLPPSSSSSTGTASPSTSATSSFRSSAATSFSSSSSVSQPSSADESSSVLSGGAIAGIVVGTVVGAIVISLVLYCCITCFCMRSDKSSFVSMKTAEEGSRNERSAAPVATDHEFEHSDTQQENGIELQHV